MSFKVAKSELFLTTSIKDSSSMKSKDGLLFMYHTSMESLNSCDFGRIFILLSQYKRNDIFVTTTLFKSTLNLIFDIQIYSATKGQIDQI
jgi:hypothetical protein